MSYNESQGVMRHQITAFDDSTGPHLRVPDALVLASGLFVRGLQMKRCHRTCGHVLDHTKGKGLGPECPPAYQ